MFYDNSEKFCPTSFKSREIDLKNIDVLLYEFNQLFFDLFILFKFVQIFRRIRNNSKKVKLW